MPYVSRFIDKCTGELVSSLPLRASRASDCIPLTVITDRDLYVSHDTFAELFTFNEEFAAQFLHLATYVRKDGILEFDDGSRFALEDVRRVLRLDDFDFGEFCSFAFNEDRPVMWADADGRNVRIVAAYAYRPDRSYGGPEHDYRFNAATLRSLFESINRFDYELIQNFLHILPFIHRETNLVCHRTREESFQRSVPFSLSEFRSWIYPENMFSVTTTEFFENFESCCFEYGGELHRVFECFDMDTAATVYVNPLLVYSGSNKSRAVGEFEYNLSRRRIEYIADEYWMEPEELYEDFDDELPYILEDEEVGDTETDGEEC